MRSYERNGVVVDQCTECRGIFLDRGELERLVEAESRFNAAPAAPAPSVEERRPERYDEPRRDDRGYDRPRYDEPRYDDRGYGGHGQPYRKKKKSFFEELFD